MGGPAFRVEVAFHQPRPPSHQRGRVSSKADDFDVRYRDVGTAGHGRPAAGGGYRGNAGDVDYDLGYDAQGWDTQGFRRPEEADYLDNHEPGPAGGVGAGTGSAGWESEATGALWAPEAPGGGHRGGGPAGARRHRGGGPAGAGGGCWGRGRRGR